MGACLGGGARAQPHAQSSRHGACKWLRATVSPSTGEGGVGLWPGSGQRGGVRRAGWRAVDLPFGRGW